MLDPLVAAAVRALKRKRAREIERLFLLGLTETEVEEELVAEVKRVLAAESDPAGLVKVFPVRDAASPPSAAATLSPRQRMVLAAVEKLGGAARPREVYDACAEEGAPLGSTHNAVSSVMWRLRDLERKGLLAREGNAGATVVRLTPRGKTMLRALLGSGGS